MMVSMTEKEKYSEYFRPEVLDIALTTLAECDSFYPIEELKRRSLVAIKYALRTLPRAAENPTIAAKLWKKKHRLDADTRCLLDLDNNATPPKELIMERISVLKNYRKLHDKEFERYRCGLLGLIYKTYGKHPDDHKLRRAFVVDELTRQCIIFPDPEKYPSQLDEWINTPVEALSPDVHREAAQQAAAIKS